MKLGELYRCAIEIGMDYYPSGRAGAVRRLASLRQRYDALPQEEQERFDRERLRNPFGDTRIANGSAEAEFDAILLGIDIRSGEALLAAELRRARPGLAVIAHHAASFERRGLSSVEDTIWTMVQHLESVGVTTTEAEGLVWEFASKTESNVAPTLADASVLQMLQALDLPAMTIHTPCDLCYEAEARAILAGCSTLGRAVAGLAAVPEMQFSAGLGQPLVALAGEPQARLGATFAAIAVGWRPPLKMMEAALKAGARTLLVVAAPPEYVALAKAYGANLIDIPHHMCDVRGMRLFYDLALRDQGVDIIPCSNYRRLG